MTQLPLVRAALVALAVLALVACDSRVHEAAAPVATPTEVRAAPVTPASPVAVDALSTPEADAVAVGVAALPRLALSAEGLDLVDPDSGSTRHLRFGSDAERVVDVLTRVLGAAPARGESSECSAGPLDFADWPDRLSVVSQEGKFAGWWINENSSGSTTPALTTIGGIGVGSTRAELEAAYAVEMMESTLGTEFAAGELFGLLDSAKPDAKVTAIWAGTSCVFR